MDSMQVERDRRKALKVERDILFARYLRQLIHRSRSALVRLIELEFGPLRSPRPEPWNPEVLTVTSNQISAPTEKCGRICQ